MNTNKSQAEQLPQDAVMNLEQIFKEETGLHPYYVIDGSYAHYYVEWLESKVESLSKDRKQCN